MAGYRTQTPTVDFQEASRKVFERNTTLSAKAAAAGKIFDTRKYDLTPQIEMCLAQFETFCSESLELWVDSIKDCEEVRRELWIRDGKLAAEIALVGLDRQHVDAQRFNRASQRYQDEKRRWIRILDSSKGGSRMLDRSVRREMLSALVNACQRG